MTTAIKTSLLFARNDHYYQQIIKKDSTHNSTILVKPGLFYRHLGTTIYQINPCQLEDYQRLFDAITPELTTAINIIHLWNLEAQATDYNYYGNSQAMLHTLQQSLSTGSQSIALIYQALCNAGFEKIDQVLYSYHGKQEQSYNNSLLHGWNNNYHKRNKKTHTKEHHQAKMPSLKVLHFSQKPTDIKKLMAIVNKELRSSSSSLVSEISYNKDIEPCNDQNSLEHAIISIIADTIKINEQAIDLDDPIDGGHFDSMRLAEFIGRINQQYHIDLLPPIFYEHKTLRSFIQYLHKHYAEQLPHSFDYSLEHSSNIEESITKKTEQASLSQEKIKAQSKPLDNEMSIAIIGIAGIMPGAPDMTSYWQQLLAAKDLISEIPKNRWHWQDYENTAKWGGFVDDMDKFDASFFKISPREAELMDPQQRLLLETTWKTIEDAGYRASDLSGHNMGVFIGAASYDYYELLTQSGYVDAHLATGTSQSILANRLSYLLDIHGSSETINTACSSSLVAICRALSAISNGECQQALVGGINALLSPSLFVSLSQAGMLSNDGQCKTFSKHANGYVRGEGVGMIWLKPLAQAQVDNDHIYAIIKGGSINHGGLVSSLTTPNPEAQAKLISSCYEKANIDPQTVSYIETNGTGTSLGDPIEVNGLKKAFSHLYKTWNKAVASTPHCGLGSVKSNIGNLESAAGIAGVLKVVLSLQHKTLPASLHCDEVNPYIELEKSPFYIVNKTRDWPTQAASLPRRAGVSSFGFGGSNAHIIVEEYCHETEQQEKSHSNEAMVIVLSAKNLTQLKTMAKNLYAFLEADKLSSLPMTPTLKNIAYTLQIGREAMEERLGFIASSLTELRKKLHTFITTEPVVHQSAIDQLTADKFETLYYAPINKNTNTSHLFNPDKDLQITLKQWVLNKQYKNILSLWVQGLKFDWNWLYSETDKLQRISLPAYPFARERHWIKTKKIKNKQQQENKTLTKSIINGSFLGEKTVKAQVEQVIIALCADYLHMDKEEFDIDTDFSEYGIDSIVGIRIIDKLQETYHKSISANAMMNYSSIRKFSDYLLNNDIISTFKTVKPMQQNVKQAFFPPNTLFHSAWLPLPDHMEVYWLRNYLSNNDYGMSIFLSTEHAIQLTYLEQAINRVIKYHPLFFIEYAKKQPWYRTRPFTEISIPYTDLSNNNDADTIVLERFRKIRDADFDNNAAAQINAELYQLPNKHYACLLTVSHSILDGFGITLLIDKINTEYQRLIDKLPVLSYQTKEDYWHVIRSYQTHLHTHHEQTLETIVTYLKKHQSFRFKQQHISYQEKQVWVRHIKKYPLSLRNDFHKIAAKKSLSSAAILALFSGLATARVTQQKEFSAGYIYHGRHLVEGIKTIGPFAKYVILNFQQNNDYSLQDYLTQLEQNSAIETLLRECSLLLNLNFTIKRGKSLATVFAHLLNLIIKQKKFSNLLHYDYSSKILSGLIYQRYASRFFHKTPQTMDLLVNEETLTQQVPSPFKINHRFENIDVRPMADTISINSYQEGNTWCISIRSRFLKPETEHKILENLDMILKQFLS